MKLSDSIKVRLREGQALVYAAQAESQGIGLAAFIRDKLDQTDRIQEELASIRAAMIDMGETMDELRDQLEKQPIGSSQEKQANGEPSAVQIETLLLMRATAGTQTRQMVMAEVERQGLEPFQIPGAPIRSR
jgi:type IV secretory pathway TrbL component